MRSKQISADEQLRLIMECRRSGLSDYQWCLANDIKPGTFYNWISRLRKRGTVIPDSSRHAMAVSSCLQEVVKVEVLSDPDLAPTQMEQSARNVTDPATISHWAVEIMLGNITVHFSNDTDKRLVEATLTCLGGASYVR